jgi:beta-lactamase superfamily II metal-dependent hydrolase
MDIAFAAYPSAFVREEPGGEKKDHLLWGDFVTFLGPEQGEWAQVRARGKTGWMRKSDTQGRRLLEINFIDIGQGDGCFIVTPEDKFILVDAGQGDNMVRFLRWRFNLKNRPQRTVPIQYAVISHPDSDHYYGFKPLFDDVQFRFETVYHNGIVEREGDDVLGPKQEIEGRDYLTEVIEDRASLGTIIADPEKVRRKWYPNLLKTAAQGGRVGDIRMLCAEDGFLPGYEGDKEVVIRTLGPVPEKDAQGKRLLRWFNDEGKTKNGHSVVLKLEYGRVKVMLGGDLNTPAEEYLLQHYTGLDPDPATPRDREDLVSKARETFEADVAKACHHGSGDFTSSYLQAVNPIATVVSSGDNESHAHPRPDALGALGKTGRGDRPLIFSTELARSATETITHPQALRDQFTELLVLRDKAENEADRKRLDDKIRKLLNEKIDRTVTVYGLINLRTDGERVLLAQKLENPGQELRRSGTSTGSNPTAMATCDISTNTKPGIIQTVG